MKISQHDAAAMDDLDNSLDSESGYSGARRIVSLTLLLFIVTGVWAWYGILDEVSTGTGKVIPSSREQVLQSLDGGILTEVEELRARGLERGTTAPRAIGYAQALAQLEGSLTEREAIAQTQALTRRYARRQVSWFKRYPDLEWWDAPAEADTLLRA